MRMIYVAGKYSGETYSEVDDNIKKAEKVSIKLLEAGWCVITPHKNYAHYEQYRAVSEKLDYRFFMKCDMEILSRCDALFAMTNSKDSPGAKEELYFAHEKGIHIYYEIDGIPEP